MIKVVTFQSNNSSDFLQALSATGWSACILNSGKSKVVTAFAEDDAWLMAMPQGSKFHHQKRSKQAVI